MKKLLKRTTKKSIALLLVALMLMTTWVWVAPTKAKAMGADDGYYYVEIFGDLTDGSSGDGILENSWTCYYKEFNGEGAESSVQLTVRSIADETAYDVPLAYGWVPGFPTRVVNNIVAEATGCGVFVDQFRYENPKITVGNGDDIKMLVGQRPDGWDSPSAGNSFSVEVLVESGNNPVPSTAKSMPITSVIIPAAGSGETASTAEVPAPIYDQYGVRMLNARANNYYLIDDAGNKLENTIESGVYVTVTGAGAFVSVNENIRNYIDGCAAIYLVAETGLNGEYATATQKINLYSHSIEDMSYEVVTAADCENNAIIKQCCLQCGADFGQFVYFENIQEYLATGHTEVIDEAIAPTCTDAGITEGKHCSVCNKVLVKQNAIAANGHVSGSIVQENIIGATCTVAGSYDSVTYCSVCSTEISRNIMEEAELGHDYEEGEVLKEATCGEAGKMKMTCKRCGEETVVELLKTENETIELFNSGLESTSPTYSSPNYDDSSFDNGGKDLYAAHSTTIQLGLSFLANQTEYTSASITINAYDTDESSGEVDGIYLVDETSDTRIRVGQLTGKDSTWTTSTITVDPSYLIAGHTYHFELTEEVSGWVVYVRKVTLNLKGVGHNYDEGVVVQEPGCLSLGTREYICKDCGAKKTSYIMFTGHSYGQSIVEKQATCTENGYSTKICSKCGSVSKTTTAKTAHTWVTFSYPFSSAFEMKASKYCSVCGNATYEIFNSGVTDTSPKYSTSNYDPTSFNNSGYDLYSDYSSMPIIQTGLSFTVNETIIGDAVLSITAYDSDVSSGEVDGIYLVNETTGVETRLGKLAGSDSTWNTTDITVPANLLTVGNKYHIKLREEVSGWVVYVRSVSITTNNVANPFTYVVTKQPTCDEDGSITYTFTNTGETNTLTIPKLEHAYDAGVVTRESTCSVKGEKLFTCTRCGATKTQELTLVAHTYDAGVITKEPTCTAFGELLKTCTSCGTTTLLKAGVLGHDFDSPVVDGSIFYEPQSVTCKVCGKKYYEIFNSGAKGAYSVYKKTDANGNLVQSNVDSRSLRNGGYDIKTPLLSEIDTGIIFRVNNRFKEPVNLEILVYTGNLLGLNGTSQVTVTLVDMNGSETVFKDDITTGCWNTVTVTLTPDLFIEGHNYYFKIKSGVFLSSAYIRSIHIAEAETAHNFVEEHIYDATCTSEGRIIYRCTDCGKYHEETTPVLGHDYDEGQVIQQPTCIEPGVFEKTCKRCGNKSSSPVPALGHSLQKAPENTVLYFESDYSGVCSRCGTFSNILFDSGRIPGSNPAAYKYSLIEYLATGNYDDTSVDNGGYDIFTSSLNLLGGLIGGTIPRAQLGLNFLVSSEIPESVKISVGLNTFGTGKSEIILFDETTGREERLIAGYPTHESWDEITIDIPNDLLIVGHRYHFELVIEKSGAAFDYIAVRNVNLYVHDAAGHKWNIGEVTKEATCETDGEITFTCADSDCGATSHKVIPALGHNLVSEVYTEATCTTDGILRTYCTRCDKYSDTVIKADHKYSLTDSKPANCEQEGYMEYTCSVCNDVFIETIIITHNYIVSGNKHATTTEAGYVTYTCTECGDNYKEIIPALGTDKYVLLVRDRIPWSIEADYNLLNKLVNEGYISGWNVTSTDKIDEINLSEYAIIYVANDQTTTTYNRLSQLKDEFEDYASNGGVVIYGACDSGWAGGTISGLLPGNVKNGTNIARYNYIFDAQHRIVTGELTDLKPITDTLLNGTYCSHTYFYKDTLPEGYKTILQDNNANPTLVEYPYGKGHILLSGLTWEFYYVREFLAASSTTTYSKNAFDDLFVYSLTLGAEEHTEHTFVASQIIDATCVENGKIVYVCTGCGETNTVILPAIGHNWGEWSDSEDNESHSRVCLNDSAHIDRIAHELDEGRIIIDATCTSKGASIHNCKVCNAEVTRVIDIKPDNHDPESVVLENACEPTCLVDGYSGDAKCTKCDVVIDNGEVIPAIGHKWSDWKDNENGTHIRNCLNDGTHTDAEDHVWGEGEVTQVATCYVPGKMLYNCTVCDADKTEDLALDADNHGEYATEISGKNDATCDTSGFTGDVICSGCKAVLTVGEVLEPLGHELTYIENGNKTHECECKRENCDYSESAECVFGNWTVVKEPECDEKGRQERVCYFCNYADSSEIDCIPHTPGKPVKENEVAPKCEVEGKNDEVVYCSVCTTEISRNTVETEPIGHKWDNGVINPESNCTVHGTITYTCLNDSKHKSTDDVALKPDIHTGKTYIEGAKDATCTADGYTGDTYCQGCKEKLSDGETIGAHGHNYVKVDSKCVAPDYGKMGYDYYECTYNSSHIHKEDIAPLVKNTYKATFIVKAPFLNEDKVIEIVTFEEGDKYVKEPAVEKYNNYTFAWDEYELSNKDITIYGRYSEIEIDDVTKPGTDTKVEYKNGVVNITLEAKAATKNIQILSQKAKPVDLILVLDQSGSMAEKLSSDGKTKRDALVDCANNFVNEIYLNALETGAEHRVAVVGFSYSNYSTGNYKNTGILATPNGKSVNYKNLTNAVYASALLPIISGDALNANITKGINSVSAEGATSAHLGLEIANDIFAATAREANRERMVLFITDGTPTTWGEETDLVISTAAKAISEANDLKNIQNATVYSVGVHASANPTAAFTSDAYGVATNKNGTFKSYDFNRFLHAVSSNYPTAGGIVVSEMGEGSKNAGYYLGVNDTSKLKDIFTKILLGNIYKVVTFDKVTIVDTISSEFTLTLEQEAKMRADLIAELGITNEDITVKRNADGTTTLRFENVRAKKVYNPDGSSYYLAKVSFQVSADEDSLGKTTVSTNTPDSGVEYDGDKISSFDMPTVTLESDRKIVVFTINGTVYRIEEAKLGDNIIAPESELAQWNIPADAIVEGDCVTFEANVVDLTEYTVTWISEGKKESATYTFGSEIAIPVPGEKEGYEFLKWTPEVPATMPNYDIAFTAVYTPKHEHQFVKAYTYGKCTEGLVTVYECSCGELKEETSKAKPHDAKALVEKTTDGTLVDKVTCQVCGVTNNQQLTYNVTYRQGSKNTVLDLTLYENESSVQPDGAIEIKFFVGESLMKKNFTVYRIDENGKKTKYTPRKENGYLIFDADHFSFYVIAELDEETGDIADDMTYDEVVCSSNGHDYKAVVTDPTCTADGYTTFTCSECGDSYKADEKGKLAHEYKSVVTKSTCTEKGYTTYTCSLCEDSYMDDYKDMLSHDYNSTVTKPTCSAMGYTTYTCKTCQHTYRGDEKATLEHDYVNGVCKHCGDSETVNCSHMCHKNNFIWKIIRFFFKIFKIQPTCQCGAKHY